MKAAAAFAAIAKTKQRAHEMKERVQLKWITKEEFEKLHPEAAAENRKLDAKYGNLRRYMYTRGQFKKEEQLTNFQPRNTIEYLLDNKLALVKVVTKAATLLKEKAASSEDSGSESDAVETADTLVKDKATIAPLSEATESAEARQKAKRRSTIGEADDTKISVQKYWSVLPKEEGATITKETYTDLMTRLALSLIPEMTLESATALATEDAENSFNRKDMDAKSHLHLDFDFFFDEMFELVDLWCASEQATEYDQFLGTLFNCVSDGKRLRAYETIKNFTKEVAEEAKRKLEPKKKPKRKKLPTERKKKKKMEVNNDWHRYKFDGQSTQCRAGMPLEIKAATVNLGDGGAGCFSLPSPMVEAEDPGKGLGDFQALQKQLQSSKAKAPSGVFSAGQKKPQKPGRHGVGVGLGLASKRANKLPEDVFNPEALVKNLSIGEAARNGSSTFTSNEPMAPRSSKDTSSLALGGSTPVGSGKSRSVADSSDTSMLWAKDVDDAEPQGGFQISGWSTLKHRGMTLSRAYQKFSRDAGLAKPTTSSFRQQSSTTTAEAAATPPLVDNLLSVGTVNKKEKTMAKVEGSKRQVEVRPPSHAKAQATPNSASSPLALNRLKPAAPQGKSRLGAAPSKGKAKIAKTSGSSQFEGLVVGNL